MSVHAVGLKLRPQQFRLLELPADLVSLIEQADKDSQAGPATARSAGSQPRSSIITLKSAVQPDSLEQDTHAFICTAESTYQIRQIQTSNCIFVAGISQSGPVGSTPSSLPLLGSCSSTYELRRSSWVVSADDDSAGPSVRIASADGLDDALDFFIHSLSEWEGRPDDFDDDDSDGDVEMVIPNVSPDTLPSSLFADVPFSDGECRIAAQLAVAFAAPPPQPAPATPQSPPASILVRARPADLLLAWRSVVQASLVLQSDLSLAGTSALAHYILFPDRRQRASNQTPPTELVDAVFRRLRLEPERFSCYSHVLPALAKCRKTSTFKRKCSITRQTGPIDSLGCAAYIGILLLYLLTATSNSSHIVGISMTEFQNEWATLLPTSWNSLTRLTVPSGLPLLISPFCFDNPLRSTGRSIDPTLMFRAWTDGPSGSTDQVVNQTSMKQMFPYTPSCPAGLRPSVNPASIPPVSSSVGAPKSKRKWHDLFAKERAKQ